MKRIGVLTSLAIGLALGNPYITTFLNEFGADSSGGWVELHYQPGTGPQFDLTGWRITTGATAYP